MDEGLFCSACAYPNSNYIHRRGCPKMPVYYPEWLTPEWCMRTFYLVNPGASGQSPIASLYLLDFARAVIRRHEHL